MSLSNVDRLSNKDTLKIHLTMNESLSNFTFCTDSTTAFQFHRIMPGGIIPYYIHLFYLPMVYSLKLFLLNTYMTSII